MGRWEGFMRFLHYRRRLVAILIVATFAMSVGDVQSRRGVTSRGSGELSASVVATWTAHSDEPSGTQELDLLILWRGSPGWFVRSSGTEMLDDPRLTENRDGVILTTVLHRILFDDHTLELQFDPRSRIARVQDDVIQIRAANVILLDEVDGAGGVQVLAAVTVNPQFAESIGIVDLVRRSPQLVEFLRCDSKMSDSDRQQILDRVCAYMREP